MENIIYVTGMSDEKELIENNCKNKVSPIYLLNSSKIKLYEYIDYLHDDCGLPNKVLQKIRICTECQLGENVTLASETGKELCKPQNMKELLSQLEIGTKYRIRIENNDRTLLANIVQQLIYIDYPITEVDIKIKKEYKDAAKTMLFMKKIDELSQAAEGAAEMLTDIYNNNLDDKADDFKKTHIEAKMAYEAIKDEIHAAQKIDMKVAVAASKKTGKSVVANCMLGQELAPTSLELATPNTCIYKRNLSEKLDERYILCYEENGQQITKPFKEVAAIRKEIEKKFKSAQADAEGHYSIPDMEILYASNGNNFESYTIFDTPGPDAAGTNHRENAKKSLEQCDVAIFAIDYSKYLTDTEEQYLREVKSIFEAKHKFHTLVFVINKIDLALKDTTGTKSRIKSIDFIRNRLREIDEKYGDCIIFATSAQNYFYTLELQNIAQKNDVCAKLLEPGCDLYDNIRSVKRELENDVDDEYVDTVLSALDSEVTLIQNHIGYSDIKAIQNYSGMPQLMNYIAYVAQSKAREEIVNSITYKIDSQCKMLETIINKIANIKEMKDKKVDEIQRISDILENYTKKVQQILCNDLQEEDVGLLEDLEEAGHAHLLAAQIEKYQKMNGEKGDSAGFQFPIRISDVLSDMGKDIIADKLKIQKDLWGKFKKLQIDKIKRQMGEIIDASETSKLGVTKEEMGEIICTYYQSMVKSELEAHQREIEGVVDDLQSIVKVRLESVELATECCKTELEKENCNLILPSMPTFDAAISIPDVNKLEFDINFDVSKRLPTSIYKDIGAVYQFFRNLGNIFKNFSMDKREVRVLKMEEADLKKEVSGMKEAFDDALNSSTIYEKIGEIMHDLSAKVKEAEVNVLNQFDEINNTYSTMIESFKASLDDRERYEQEREQWEQMEDLITKIREASADFLAIWNEIVAG